MMARFLFTTQNLGAPRCTDPIRNQNYGKKVRAQRAVDLLGSWLTPPPPPPSPNPSCVSCTSCWIPQEYL